MVCFVFKKNKKFWKFCDWRYCIFVSERYAITDAMIRILLNSAPSYLSSSNSMGIVWNNGYCECTVDTSSSGGRYMGMYWVASTTNIEGYHLSDWLGNSWRWEANMDIDNNNQNIWKLQVYIYKNGGFTALECKDSVTGETASYLVNGNNGIDFTIPSDAERVWLRLDAKDRISTYTCKTKDWRIYPI